MRSGLDELSVRVKFWSYDLNKLSV